ncbi:MAG: COX15/CtaA family protein [Proteobacteria bacterium]|nr:COX15/CtaA family protein [Pseudomonadota bacterium]
MHPGIVMSHLLGGFLMLCLLCWLALSHTPSISKYRYAGHVKPNMVVFGLILLILQIALGGWTSANYAALACVGFPQCNGLWLPEMNFVEGFNLFRAYGPNYEFGLLDAPSRIAIQMSHRIGAVLVTAYLVWLSYRLTKNRELLPLGLVLLSLLVLQVALGIINVSYMLPLAVASAHNVVAALLLLTLVTLLYKTRS